jgi:toxin CptA
VLLMTLLALVALFRSALPVSGAALGMTAVLLYCWWIWPRQVSLRHAQSITGLRFDSHGWHLLRRDGSEAGADLQPDTFVSAFLTVVRLREPGRLLPVSVILPADSASEDALRRLRLRLRFSRQRWAAAE